MEVVVPVPSSSIPCIDALIRASLVTATRVASLGSDIVRVMFSCGSADSSKAVFRNAPWMSSFSNGRCEIGVARTPDISENGTSAVSGCIRGSLSYLSDRAEDNVLVLPFNWYSPVKADMSSLYSVLSEESPVVFLGGWSTDSATGYFPGRLAPHSDRFLRVEIDNCTVEQLLRTDVPFVTKVSFLSRGLFGGSVDKQQVLYSTNFGRNPPYVLFPKSLHSEPGDGKPQIFFDVVGICRQFRDRCSDYDSEIGVLTESKFNMEEPLWRSHTTV